MISFIKRYYERLSLAVIVIFAIILRFIPISFSDTYGDGAINSFRAFGWLDWLLKSGQSTPFEWLGYIPDWAYLSFHDAPPMAFFIQHIFFIFGGNGIVTARLPFVFAGVGSILLVYFLVKKLTDPKTACIASILYSITSYSIWAEHSMYLEGMEEFFIVGSILLTAVFLFRGNKSKYLYLSVIFIAFAIMTKYTAIFLIPPILIYAWLYRKNIFQYRKQIIVSLIIGFIILSPIIIYNLKVYELRGHFDAALSSMVGMHPEDFSIISGRSVSLDIVGNFTKIYKTLAKNMSLPLLILIVISIIYTIFTVIKSRSLCTFRGWIIINLLFLILLFTFTGSADRFLSIFVPLLVITLALGILDIWEVLTQSKNRILIHSFFLAICLVFAYEFIYSINTNVLRKPWGVSYWSYSPNKLRNLGFNQLDSYIRDSIITKLPKKDPVRKKEDTTLIDEDIEGRSVIISDDRILWFSQMWYFQRYYVYYRWPFISTAFLDSLKGDGIDLDDLRETSKQKTYFIYPVDPLVIDPSRTADKHMSGITLAKEFDNKQIPFKEIKNLDGVSMFRIYEIPSYPQLSVVGN